MRSPEIPRRLVGRRSATEFTPPANCLRAVVLITLILVVGLGSAVYSHGATEAPDVAACEQPSRSPREVRAIRDGSNLDGPAPADRVSWHICTRVAARDAGGVVRATGAAPQVTRSP